LLTSYDASLIIFTETSAIGAKFDLVIASIAIATMESDLKSLIQYLETALQITLLKYEAALAAAQNSRTSPYALSQTELIKLVTETHLKMHHTIDSDINHAHKTAIVINKTLTFLIEIPLLDDDKFFNFYSVKTIPIFCMLLKYFMQLGFYLSNGVTDTLESSSILIYSELHMSL
jgi:hypothetical protein